MSDMRERVPDSPTAEDVACDEVLRQLAAFIGKPLSLRDAVLPIASPMHRALTSRCLWVNSGVDRGASSGPLFVKILHADMADWVDMSLAARANAQAAAQGWAPAVLADCVEPACIVNEYLAPPWRTALLGDLMQPATLESLLTLKRRLHQLPLLGARFDVFERIERLAMWGRGSGAPLPPDLDTLLLAAQQARTALHAAGMDICPGHNHGVASNVMLNDKAGMMLLDFDLAGDTDPWFDLASSLLEVCQTESDWALGIELGAGRFSPAHHARARLYGAADDLMWGLWGCHFAKASARPGIEFFKYAQWRLLRCRQTIGHVAFGQWLLSV